MDNAEILEFTKRLKTLTAEEAAGVLGALRDLRHVVLDLEGVGWSEKRLREEQRCDDNTPGTRPVC